MCSIKPDGTTLAKSTLKLISHSAIETQQLGRIIGELARPGDVILLCGPLGAGKTCLTQGLAQGMGVNESAASPSYVLMRELSGRLPLYHMDLYRLEFEEIDELGLDDYLYGLGVCVIEWAEKAGALIPSEHLLVTLGYAGESQRNIDIVPGGVRYEPMARNIATAFDSLKKDIK
jgi:tRNA threonylcarbamoyladenosine biosynthesis protein TsaE